MNGFRILNNSRMGSRASKPQPSARTPSRWISNAWRTVKKSPRLRKKSKDSQKSKKSSEVSSFLLFVYRGHQGLLITTAECGD